MSWSSASQVPRRAVEGYINNQDSNWPIITNKGLVINYEEGGLQNGREVCKVLPPRKWGGGGGSFSHAEGGGGGRTQSFGVVFML